jgi:hypothetical protein
MKYEKPQVVLAGLAVKAIESSAKEDQNPFDGTDYTTLSAYQADE